MIEPDRYERLKRDGIIPVDSRVISTHNNLVVASDAERTVSRIRTLGDIAGHDDPSDLRYSHRVSKFLGRAAGVVAPIDDEPLQYEDIIISTYPMKGIPDWNVVDGRELSNAIGKLNDYPLESIPGRLSIRRLDVAAYAAARLGSLDPPRWPAVQAYVGDMLAKYVQRYDFSAAVSADPALTHGDLHAGNVVSDDDGLLFIDLDSIAVGPREYDLASWCVRQLQGDPAPAAEAAAYHADTAAFRIMAGWKVLSSMTHALKYQPSDPSEHVDRLSLVARHLDAPGTWIHHVG